MDEEKSKPSNGVIEAQIDMPIKKIGWVIKTQIQILITKIGDSIPTKGKTGFLRQEENLAPPSMSMIGARSSAPEQLDEI